MIQVVLIIPVASDSWSYPLGHAAFKEAVLATASIVSTSLLARISVFAHLTKLIATAQSINQDRALSPQVNFQLATRN